jgi:hypothetical protein
LFISLVWLFPLRATSHSHTAAQIHTHTREKMSEAVEAHEAARAAQAAMEKRNLLLAIKEYMRAAEKFGEATRCTEDEFTIEALQMLALSHAKQARDVAHEMALSLSKDDQVMLRETRQLGGDLDEGEKKQDVTSDEEHTPEANGGLKANQMLKKRWLEMLELEKKLSELGCAQNYNLDRMRLLSSSRQLSSSLGDSFCFPRQSNPGNVEPVSPGLGAPGGWGVDGSPPRRKGAVEAACEPVSPGLGNGPFTTVTTRSISDSRGGSSSGSSGGSSSGSCGKPFSTSLLSMSQALPAENADTALSYATQQSELMRLLNTINTLTKENANLLKVLRVPCPL